MTTRSSTPPSTGAVRRLAAATTKRHHLWSSAHDGRGKVTGVRLPTRVGYPMPVFAGVLATPKVPLCVVRHRSGFVRGRVRADAAGPDDGPGRRRADSADGVWKIAHRIVTDDWSMWADCTEKVARLGTHTGLASKDNPSYTAWGQGFIARSNERPSMKRPIVETLRETVA